METPSDEIQVDLQGCAAGIAERASALCARNRADKFSIQSELVLSVSQKLNVPSGETAGIILPFRRNMADLPAELRPFEVPGPVANAQKRPQWSVVIPVRDPDPKFFPIQLAAIVKALSRAESWEILIADDASREPVEGLIGEHSKHPVQVYRFESPVGLAVATNECLCRSRGHLVHVFSQDALVFESFYSRLAGALKKNPEVGVAACHNNFCDYENILRGAVSAQEPTGCYKDTRYAAIWAYRIPFSAFVVRRSIYEALGGFSPDLGQWSDWEMKARLLSASPLFFDSGALSLERFHPSSLRQRSRSGAPGLASCTAAIAVASRYYPASLAAEFSAMATQLFAYDFARFGSCLLTAGRTGSGLAYLNAAQRLCPQDDIASLISKRTFYLLKSQEDAKPDPCDDTPPVEADTSISNSGDFFPEDEFHGLEAIISAYRNNPADPAAQEQVRALRTGLCGYLLDAQQAELENLFSNNFGKIFSLLRESGLFSEAETAEEKILRERAGILLAASPGDPRGLLATMLLCPAHRGSIPVDFGGKPEWIARIYLDYLLASPDGFVLPGEADMYWAHLTSILTTACSEIARNTTAPTVKNALFQVALRLNVIPAYFSERDMKDLMRMRALVIRFLLEQSGHRLEVAFPPRPFQRKKIRVGFLSAHLGPQTETYTSVPSFYLDREKFEIHLFVLGNNPSAIEAHCRSVVDSFTVLPAEFAARVENLRGAGLDVLVIGTNMTAVTNDITLLGTCRLAPIQIASSSSPMTPGLPYLDGFLSGIIHGYDAYSGQYNERLLLFDGAISCLEYSVDRPKAETDFNRRDFGIPDGVPLFVSGANFFKILPELQATWAKILQQVPGSYLLLHPFNRNWSSRYPIARFRRDIRWVLEQAGVDPSRVVISEETLPSRADVCQLMSLGDVYLDSFPFSGSVSLVDPLEAGVPPVAWRAVSTRGLMAASMLSDLDLRELVAESEEGYVASAVRLATDPQERERISAKIRSAMAAGPRFFDVQKYGREVSRVLEQVVLAERKTETVTTNKEILRRAEAALVSGQLGEVEDLCRYLLEREPATAACWALLAELARRCGDLSYASDLAGQAVELEPDRANFWSALGEIRREKMDPDGAMDAFRRALELSPTFPTAWLGKALVHEGRKEFTQAEQAYSQALVSSKDRVETARIRVSFASFLKEQKRMKEAIKQLHQAVSAVPDSYETMLLLGCFLTEGGDLGEAQSTFSRVTKKFPGSGRGWLEWGKALLLHGKIGEAVEKMRKAVACQPDDPDALFNLGRALQQNGQRTESLQAYRDAERAGYDAEDLHANIGVLLKE